MTTTTTDNQIEYSSFRFPELAKAVIEQMGGEEDFLENWENILNHGISGGFSGFIYYSETTQFSRRNMQLIREMAKQQADDLGLGMLEMIAGFNCIGNDYTVDDVGEVVYGDNDDTTILNALAWYAAEETCHQFSISQDY